MKFLKSSNRTNSQNKFLSDDFEENDSHNGETRKNKNKNSQDSSDIDEDDDDYEPPFQDLFPEVEKSREKESKFKYYIYI